MLILKLIYRNLHPFFLYSIGNAICYNNLVAYQIDQSGKIEQTSKVTVIAISNSIQATIILKAKDKRDLQDIYRQAGKPKVFAIQVFSALTYLLLEKAKIEIGMVYIDKEYPGHEAIIKSYVNQLIKKRGKINLEPENIRFTLVGKSSNVHLYGYKKFKRRKADYKVTKEDILAMILNFEK